MELGYACINVELSSRKPKVSTNRKVIKATFNKPDGYKILSERVLQNVKDLNTILVWNEMNNIRFFRMSSDIISFQGLFDLERLPDIEQIRHQLLRAGKFAEEHGHRLTLHPGPFNVLASPRKQVVENAIRELKVHGDLMDMMGLTQTPYNKINIHLWASYDDREATARRFCENFGYLPDNVKNRLTVENDDRPSLYSIEHLFELVHSRIKVPLVLDYHHFEFIETEDSLAEALATSCHTWPKGITPVVHYSEGKIDGSGNITRKHSYFIDNQIPTFDRDLDIMIEAKGKEQALLTYRKKYE